MTTLGAIFAYSRPCREPSFRIFAGALQRRPVPNDLADRGDMFFEIDVAFFGDQRRIGSNSIGKAKRRCLRESRRDLQYQEKTS